MQNPIHIAGIIENGAEMGDVEFPARGIGGLDPGQVGVHIAEFAIDDLDARGLGKGLEGVFRNASETEPPQPSKRMDLAAQASLTAFPKGASRTVPWQAPASPRYLMK
jgi:hypothetical protein